jgi:BASS family bile acid:Na+ symporter
MSVAALILVWVKASIFVTVLALGMSARGSYVWYLLRRPGRLLRSLLAMNVIMPLIAAALAAAFNLPSVVKVALIALAVSPVPPFLPSRELKAGGRSGYTVGLLVTAALSAVALVPATVALLGWMFGRETSVPIATIASIVATSVLAPLAVGLAVRHVAPEPANRLARPLATLGNILLLVASVPILVGAWPSVAGLIGDGTVIAFAAFSVIGLAVGHWLGGPDPDERTALALSTASRHPAIAVAVGTAALADLETLLGAVVLYVIVSVLVSVPYVKRRPRGGAGVGGPVLHRPFTPRTSTVRRAAS